MKGFCVALWSEFLKLKRSKIFITLLLLFVFIGLMMGLLMFMVKHPELAAKSASVATKASIVRKADWLSYFALMIQASLSIGVIGFGTAAAWIFGREYADRTIKDLLSLPVSRPVIVTAKFCLTALWCTLLMAALYGSGILTGLLIGLDGWDNSLFIQHTSIYFLSSLLTLVLVTPVAFFASFSRGYLPPIGFTMLTLILTNFLAIGIPGITPYFPWAIPALVSGVAGQGLPNAGLISAIILTGTSLAGLLGTIAWWRYADQL